MDLVVRAPRLPKPGETVAGTEFMTVPGGKGANQAVGAACLGATSLMVGRIGGDVYGEIALHALRDAGVVTDHIVTDTTTTTGVALITVNDAGENCITIAPGANGTFSEKDVARFTALLSTADVALLQLECALIHVHAAARAAKDAGVPVIFTPAPLSSDIPQDMIDSIIAASHIVVPNTTEAECLTGRACATYEDACAAAKEICVRGATHTVITRGGEGAVWCDGTECVDIPAVPVEAVDTVGAGDAFCAALAVAYAEKKPMRDALMFATAAAAWNVRYHGAQAGMPQRTDVSHMKTCIINR